MNILNKLERKFGRYAIHNLMYYIIILYGVGVAINLVNPYFYYQYLSLDAGKILHGQVWRIVTFLMQPPSDRILWNVIAIYLYYMLGMNLERTWGAFRFNFYFLMGVLGHVLAAIIIYLIFGYSMLLGTTYLNLSLFFGFATMYPNLEFLLFFVIPVKAKYLAIFNGVIFGYNILFGPWAIKIAALLSLANFIVFFMMTRTRINPIDMKRRASYKAQVKVVAGKTHHKCAICGRTEKDGDDLVFRYCSKCEGNYEYCQDHLYTHRHVTSDEGAPH